MFGKVTATSLPLQKNARAPIVTGAVSRPHRARARGAAAGGRQRCAASRRLPPQPRPWRRPAGREAMEPRRPLPGPRSPPAAACRCRAHPPQPGGPRVGAGCRPQPRLGCLRRRKAAAAPRSRGAAGARLPQRERVQIEVSRPHRKCQFNISFNYFTHLPLELVTVVCTDQSMHYP